ncbi:MAG: hypothetical protein FI726_06935 [SAR202 cluster bacterium]|nr:hypothetical protein [SAR202 cluster bacterium]
MANESCASLWQPYFQIWKGLNSALLPEAHNDQIETFLMESLDSLDLKVISSFKISRLSPRHRDPDLYEILSGESLRGIGLANFFDEDVYSWIYNDKTQTVIGQYYNKLRTVLDQEHVATGILEGIVETYGSTYLLDRLAEVPFKSAVTINENEFVLLNEEGSISKLDWAASQMLTQGPMDPKEKSKFLLARLAVYHDCTLSGVMAKAWFLDRLIEFEDVGNDWHFAPVFYQVPNSLTNEGDVNSTFLSIVGYTEKIYMIPFYLDWMLYRMEQYINAAQLRMLNGFNKEVADDICNSFLDYLKAKKPRTPVPDAVNSDNADCLVEILWCLISTISPRSGYVLLQAVRPMLTGMSARKEQWDVCI